MGQRIGDNLKETYIAANTIEEIHQQLWDEAKKHVSREIIIYSDKSCSIENRKPTIKDLDKFVTLQDKVAKKIYLPSSIKPEIARTFANRNVNVLVYYYSTNVENAQIWNNIREKVEELEKKDRSSTLALIQMTDRINKLSAQTIPNLNFLTDHLKTPKTLSVKNFTSHDKIEKIMKVDQEFRIPKHVQDAYRKDWESMRESFDAVKSAVNTVVDVMNEMGSKFQDDGDSESDQNGITSKDEGKQ